MSNKLQITIYWVLSVMLIIVLMSISFFTDSNSLSHRISTPIDGIEELKEDNIIFEEESFTFSFDPEYENVELISISIAMDDDKVFGGLTRLEKERLVHNTSREDVLYQFQLFACDIQEKCSNTIIDVNKQTGKHNFEIDITDFDRSTITFSFLNLEATEDSNAQNYVIIGTNEDTLLTNVTYKITSIDNLPLLFDKLLKNFTLTQWAFIFIFVIFSSLLALGLKSFVSIKFPFFLIIFFQLIAALIIFELSTDILFIEENTPDFSKKFEKFFVYLSVIMGLLGIHFFQKENNSQRNKFRISKSMQVGILLLSIMLFLVLRIPHFGANYVNQYHADKYSSYLPTSQYMYEQGDPFVQISPGTNDIESNMFERDSFVGFPFYEWTFSPFWIIEGSVDQEVIVHFVMSMLGILLLLLFYIALEKIVRKEVALVSLLVLAVSPFMQLFTFITIMDLPAFIFFLLFIIFLIQKKPVLAYTAAGTSVVLKLSFISLVIPFGILFVLREHAKEKRLFELMKFFSISLLQFIVFKIFLSSAPSQSTVMNVAGILIYILIIFVPIILFHFKDSFFLSIYKKYEKPLWVIGVLTGLVVFVGDYNNLLSNFAPEPIVLLTPNLYTTIINDIAVHTSVSMFVLGLIGLMYIARTRNYFFNFLVLAGFIYFFVGSKVIYFHIYYKHIFVFLLLIAAIYLLFEFQKKSKEFIFIIFFLIIAVTVTYSLRVPDYLERNSTVQPENAATYLAKNIGDGERVLRSDSLTKNLVLYNQDLEFVNLNSSSVERQSEFKDRVEEVGLATFLLENNVTYFVNLGSADFESFAPLLFDNYILYNRKDTIRGKRTDVLPEDIDIIKSHFELEEIIGEFYIYTIKPNERQNSDS